jgi:glutamate/tyrosine decarboxylase-like PLP-dependent enzyme
VASYVGVAGTTFTGGTDDVRVVAPASPDVSIAGLSFALYLTT